MADFSQLKELRQDSGRRLPGSIIQGLTVFVSNVSGVEIVTANGRQTARRISASVVGADPRKQQRIRQLGTHDHFTMLLNNALLGASDYPVLNAVLGTAVGFGTGGAGYLFTAATTAVSLSQVAAPVLARDGDEIWRVEEIGKVTSGGQPRPTYVLAYFLFDPYRGHSVGLKGWLLHEARFDLTD